MTTFKKDDIVFWSYTTQYVDGLSYKQDLYWAKSRIAVFDGENFVDTFWHGSNNLRFSPSQIGEKFEVQYVANFADLDKQNDYIKFEDLDKFYEKEDIVNLNHPNDSRGNLYLRKSAKRSIKKIRQKLEQKLKDDESRLLYAQAKLEQEKLLLENLNEETVKDIYF